ncbi:hypothetical protein CCUS01_11140 [Colletotrichum cuscutae]|uniref:Uncharacterized protein n=1 Tax=Colletotrichum cuscutae TaxID=1209917 RepID=A0AAI9XJD8_9PEZI|nr:hypothetical protein CCUS01_11140 [Colletotrichum cuscutae]
MSVPLFIVEGDQCSRKFTTWFAVGLPPWTGRFDPSPRWLARAVSLHMGGSRWRRGRSCAGLVPFSSIPAALAVGNFHGTLLLPRGLGCPVGSTNAKRQQRCFHGFVCNSSFAPRSVPGVAELGVLSYPCWDKRGSFSAVAFLQVLPCGAWHES